MLAKKLSDADECHVISNIMDIIVSYAPDNVDTLKLRRALSDSVTVKSITGVLYDGLAYGNWPWVAYTVLGNRFTKS